MQEYDRSVVWSRATQIGGAGAVLLALLALAGWVLDAPWLSAGKPGWVPMAPSTALLFVVFGGLLTATGGHPEWGQLRHPAARLLAPFGLAAAAALLGLSMTGVHPGIEHLGMDIAGRVAGVRAGHMSPLTAVGFLLAGGALLLLAAPVRGGHWRELLGLGAALLLTLLAGTLFGSYLVQRPLLYGTGTIPPALGTAAAFLSLGAGLLARATPRARPRRVGLDQPRHSDGSLVLGLLGAGLLVIAPAYFLFRDFEANYRAKVEAQLEAVATLKVAIIEDWRRERLADMSAFANDNGFVQLAEGALYQKDPVARRHLLARMAAVREAYGYLRIAIHDTAGTDRISVPAAGRGPGYAQHPAGRTLKAMHAGGVVFEDFHRDATAGPVHLTLVAPLQSDGTPAAAAVVRVDPGLYLYPMLQRWPTSSRTAETLLVRRDGEDVLFLNDLRFTDHPAMEFRLPLSRTELPAAQAILGARGIVHGSDYRGHPVVAAVQPVTGTGWFLVARVDTAEVFGPVHEQLAWTVALVVVLLTSMVGAMALRWNSRERAHLTQLMHAEEHYGALLRNMRDAVVAADAEGRVELINAAGEHLTGWPESEARGLPLAQVVPLRDGSAGEADLALFEQISSSGTTDGAPEFRTLRRRDGTECPVACTGAPVRDLEDRHLGVVLVLRDHTAEEEAQRALAERERKYRGLFDSMRDALLVTDTERRIVDCNPAFTEVFGYELSDVLGQHTSVLYESQEEFERMGRQLRAARHPGFVVTVRYRRKDGDIFPGETGAFGLLDDDGQVSGFVGLVRDIGDRLSIERQLTASEERYRTLVEAAPVGIFRSHSQGHLLSVNERLACMLRCTSADEALTHYTDVARQFYADEGRRTQLLDRLRTHGQVEHFEFDALAVDGTALVLEMSARVARTLADGEFEVEGFLTDVTEQRRAEQERTLLESQLAQAQKIESIGRLAGGVAHDFNNMLTVILGQVQRVLARLDADSSLREPLHTIEQAGVRSADLTRQLLAFARVQVVQPRVLDLNETVEGMLKMLRRLIGEQIELGWQPSSEPLSVCVDPVQIDQVLANLVVNARDAIEGSGYVTIRSSREHVDADYARSHVDASPGDYAVLSVTDDGQGMSPEVRAQVFEPFFTTKPSGEGTGLGLSTVHGIARQNEGFVNVHSEPGQGTTFHVYLPCAGPGAAGSEPEADAAATAGGSETLLVVEDEPALLEVARDGLEDLGYKVLGCTRPQEARTLAATQGPVDLLVTDVVMPGMNGRELAASLQADHPELRVIYMSGYPADVMGEGGVLDEGIHFIEKPFSGKRLGRLVRQVLDG